mgnify:FL=1
MSFFKKLLGQKGEPEPAKLSQAAAQRTAPPVAPPASPPASPAPEIVPQPAQRIYRSGDTILGRYEVVGEPLKGGMGIVYICVDQQQDLPVALKTFKPEYLPDRATRDRFLREGTTWMNLGAHPHIVRCYEVIRDATGLEVFLALEPIAKEQGREDASLRSWLFRGYPLPPETALLFVLQIARGMQHAVARVPGFVHRDLKPENVLVGADRLPDTTINRLRVTDFGLASVIQEARSKRQNVGGAKQEASAIRHTQLTHGAVGTPLYMAPEQWTGQPVGVYTDVYALGCILYEMLTGYTAAAGDNPDDLARAHCAGNLRPLPESTPTPVRYILQRCLAFNPGDRYTDWENLEFVLASAYAAIAGHAAPSPVNAMTSSLEERIQVGWSYNAIGLSYLDIGKAKVAMSYFGQALAISCEIGDRYGEGTVLGNLGNAYADLGDARYAIKYYGQALAIAREIGNRRGEGGALGNLGVAYTDLGDVRHAIEYFEQALAIAREIGDRHGEGSSLSNLGVAYANLGDLQHAIGYHKLALVVRREIGDRRGEGNDLVNLGSAYAQLGDVEHAIEYFKQALAITREIGDRRGEGGALGNLGVAYADLNDARRAIEYYEQALAIQREIGNQHGEGTVLGNLGTAYADLDDARHAIEYFEQALAIAREIGDRHGEGSSLGNLGNAYTDLNDARRAIEYHEQSLAIQREIGNRRGEGTVLGNLGNAYSRLGDVRRAIEYYEQALALARETGDINGVAFDSCKMALLYDQQGDPVRAIPLAQEAARLWTQIGSPNAQQVQQLIARLQAEITTNEDPATAQMLNHFAPLIQAVIAAARGNRQARADVEEALPQLEKNNWHIAGPIRRIWAGERNEAPLVAGLDDSDALIMREILRQLRN